MNNAVMFSRACDEWSTPLSFYDWLNTEFLFSVDAAANRDNARCNLFYGPGGATEDALALRHWNGPFRRESIWLNPPYSKCREFIAKAAEQAKLGNTVVCLVPSRTDTRWWHEHVWDSQKHAPRPGVEIRFVKGRLKFGGATAGAPFPSVVIIFRPTT